MQRGFIPLGKIGGVPLRLHVFAVVALVLLAIFSSRPVLGAAMFGILVAHELGHAALARRAGFEVVAIDLGVIQGACRYRGHVTPRAEAVVAWGGILAQLVLLAFACGARTLVHPDDGALLGDIADAWFLPNVAIMAFNLLPFGGLDGRKAWTAFRPSAVKKVVRTVVLDARAAQLKRDLAAVEARRKTRSKYDVN